MTGSALLEVVVDVVALVGRILFAAIFLGSSVAHFTQSEGMGALVESKGLPAGRLLVLVSGVLIALGGLMIVLGVWADLGALFVLAFTLPTAFLVHAFWKETDPMAKQNEMVNFMKNLSISGGALLFFSLYAGHAHDLGLTITGPLFG
ncbi:DoxX family protein [Umezawaea sp. NPDC059074]|uniref:DoxX family protein n=1 Tax=Umezawaea sp. NPDC059074 TaxID=3346716 RepID=UPI0036819EAF